MALIHRVLLAVLTFAIVGQVRADGHAGAALAERYGLSGWDQIESIGFAFNVKTPDRETKRHWRWDVKARQVTRTVDGESRTISLADGKLEDEADRQVDSQFINDSYWLLFPFQLVWSDPTVTEEDVDAYPIVESVERPAPRKLVCQWPVEGGYTPGDAYDLYLGQDGLIEQWAFRKGGKDGGGWPTTWDDHQQLGPIIVALDHRSADGNFRLWFTDVKATLADGTAVSPRPLGEPAAAGGVESQ